MARAELCYLWYSRRYNPTADHRKTFLITKGFTVEGGLALVPGGAGSPLGRHHDRSPRSSVNSRQATTGNARRAGSRQTRNWS